MGTLEEWYGPQEARRIRAQQRRRARVHVPFREFGAVQAAPAQKYTAEQQYAIGSKLNEAMQNFYRAADVIQVKLEARSWTSIVTMFMPLIKGILNMVGFSAITGEAATNVKGAISTLRRAFDAQMIPARDAVIAGTMTVDVWFEKYNIFMDGLGEIYKVADDYTTIKLYRELAADMLKSAKNIGGKGLDFLAWFYENRILVASVAAGLVILYALNRGRAITGLGDLPRLAGYNRRRTRR